MHPSSTRLRVPMLSIAAALMTSIAAVAQSQSSDDGFWTRWFQRSDQAKADQPHWITPLATTTPRLEQEFRYDFDFSQARPRGPYTETYGNSKGLELIPLEDMEIIIGIPSYIIHPNNTTADGWSDVQLLMKYRMFSSNEQNDDYILTAFLSSSLPTGTPRIGQPKAIVTPALGYGKGWEGFDMQGNVGISEPVANAQTIGRTISWNHAFQIEPSPGWWPEVEVNQSWFTGGPRAPNNGKKQTFVTPGLVLGSTPLSERVGFTFGAGVQMAVSKFHTANHVIVVSTRFPF